MALLAPLIAPQDPHAQNLHQTFVAESWEHLMGTDNLGRDWFSRLLYGARHLMAVGIFAQAIVLSIGLTIGLIAGFFGGASTACSCASPTWSTPSRTCC